MMHLLLVIDSRRVTRKVYVEHVISHGYQLMLLHDRLLLSSGRLDEIVWKVIQVASLALKVTDLRGLLSWLYTS